MRVCAIVPARNEEASIGACVESLLAQPEIERVIVADDSSTDGTAARVDAIAAREPRVTRLAVPPLPAGWVGKNHAVHVAQACEAARDAGWLLFTDADTIHEPGRLGPLLAEAEREGIHLWSLSPHQEAETFWEKAVIPRVFLQLSRLYSFDRVNDPRHASAAANGQYLLIRREVYDAIGGHAAARGEILEDVALAGAAKRAGYRLRFASGAGIVRTRMYRDFSSLWQGWTKNLFLLYGRRPARVLRTASALVALDLVIPAALAVSLPPSAVVWIALRHVWFWQRFRGLALYAWPGALLFAALLLNSLARHSMGRPLAWKGRTYLPGAPAAQL